jgi:hypothetical protein
MCKVNTLICAIYYATNVPQFTAFNKLMLPSRERQNLLIGLTKPARQKCCKEICEWFWEEQFYLKDNFGNFQWCAVEYTCKISN